MKHPELGKDAALIVDASGTIFVPACDKACARWKRVLDVTIAATVLAVTAPIAVVFAALVRITSPGPVIYRARRMGLSGKSFHMLKFRSMYRDADKRVQELWAQNDQEGPVFKIKNDPRITPLGRFMRRYSIDEIPQFWNVLTGEMSLVGPRALHDYEIAKFDDLARQRLSVKPGITCYWQIMGRSDLSFDEWMTLDRKYIDDMCLRTDLSILRRTPRAVFKGSGAY